MKQTRNNEKGAIIVEVIAVIALLGVLGPLLFKQVTSRNEEVENISLASEIRSVKEAFSAYILTNKQTLSRMDKCQGISEDLLASFMPVGMEETLGDYGLILCSVASDDAAPTFIQGFVIPKSDILPDSFNLKRAARIATLIGADGGIYQNNTVNGTGGAWHLDEDNFESSEDWGTIEEVLQNSNGGKYTYLATTGMDTYVPEYIVEDYSSGYVTIPDNLVFTKLHAANYFAIGDGDNKCYVPKHQTMQLGADGYKAVDDEIYEPGENGCSPLFWVGSTTGASSAGRVYVKNGLEIGRNHAKGKTAVNISGLSENENTDSYDAVLSENNKIEVYDNTGTSRVLINGKGEIVAVSSTYKKDGSTPAPGEVLTPDTAETLTIADGQIKSNVTAEQAGSEYKVDPAFTSVMKDIRLESRGGARLSEILPNYISKDIVSVSGLDSEVGFPSCPRGYAPAIIVLPVSWGQASIQPSDVIVSNEVDDGAGGTTTVNESRIKVDVQPDVEVKNINMKTDEYSGGTAGEAHAHSHSIVKSDSTDENYATGKLKTTEATVSMTGNISIANSGLVIEINSDTDGESMKKEDTTADDSNRTDGNWKINFYYPSDTARAQKRTDVKAIAQTYCVYDTTENVNVDYSGKLDR